MQLANEGARAVIAIKRFWTTYEPDRDPDRKGQLREVDWVEYGPIGNLDLVSNIEKISRLAKVIDRADAADNAAVQLANIRWDAIRPQYEAWKAGRSGHVDGTPLAAWNRLSPEQADVLRIKGVKTVEEIAALGDTHIQRLGLPGMREVIADAKRFLAATDASAVQQDLRAKDEQLAAQRDELAEMKAQVETLAEIVRTNMAREVAEDATEIPSQNPAQYPETPSQNSLAGDDVVWVSASDVTGNAEHDATSRERALATEVAVRRGPGRPPKTQAAA